MNAKRFHSGLSFLLISITISSLCATALIIGEIATSKPVLAAHCGAVGDPNGRCFRGRAINVGNFGTVAQMGTTNPNVPAGHVSFMLVQSRSGNLFIQTGWEKQDNTNGHVRVLWESYNPARCVPGNNGPNCAYHNGAFDPTGVGGDVTGDNNYYVDYDGTSWCHGFGSSFCFKQEYPGGTVQLDLVGMGSAPTYAPPGTVAYYGETDDDTAQMGGPNGANAIYILNPRYKVTTNGSLSNGTYVKQAGNGYNNDDCGIVNCPYRYGTDFPATVLDIWVWTI